MPETLRLHKTPCARDPNHAGLAFQNREKYLLPFLSLQIMDFLLCLLTLMGSYIELPAYLKFASRSSRRVVSMSRVPVPCLPTSSGGDRGAQAGEGRSPQGPFLVGEVEQVSEPLQISPHFFL